MTSSLFLVTLLIIGTSLNFTESFRATSKFSSRGSGCSTIRMFSDVPNALGESSLHNFLTTTITTAVETVSNDIIVKQVFEPQISTETGLGTTKAFLIVL